MVRYNRRGQYLKKIATSDVPSFDSSSSDLLPAAQSEISKSFQRIHLFWWSFPIFGPFIIEGEGFRSHW